MIRLRRAGPTIEKPQQTLVDLRLPNDLSAFQRSDPVNNRPGVSAGPVNQLRDTVSTQLADRRIGGEAAAAARPLRVPVDLVARIIAGVA